MHHVMQGMLPGGSDQERAIGALEEGHHADESDVDLVGGGCGVDRLPESCTCGRDPAERDSTDKITTIHVVRSYFGGLSIGAVNHQRSPSAESTAVLL